MSAESLQRVKGLIEGDATAACTWRAFARLAKPKQASEKSNTSDR